MKIQKFITLFLLLTTFAFTAKGQFGGGGGTSSSDPYEISTSAHLDAIRGSYLASGVYFKLMNDIDLEDYLSSGNPGYNGGAGWLPIGDNTTQFHGNFDGNGKKITGLWINRTTSRIGLFGATNNATIENLGVELATSGIVGNGRVGGLIGDKAGGNTNNCYIIGDCNGGTGLWTGGLVGQKQSGNINDCYFAGIISGGNLTGGLVGSNDAGNINNSYAAATVTGNNTVGGLREQMQETSVIVMPLDL